MEPHRDTLARPDPFWLERPRRAQVGCRGESRDQPVADVHERDDRRPVQRRFRERKPHTRQGERGDQPDAPPVGCHRPPSRLIALTVRSTRRRRSRSGTSQSRRRAQRDTSPASTPLASVSPVHSPRRTARLAVAGETFSVSAYASAASSARSDRTRSQASPPPRTAVPTSVPSLSASRSSVERSGVPSNWSPSARDRRHGTAPTSTAATPPSTSSNFRGPRGGNSVSRPFNRSRADQPRREHESDTEQRRQHTEHAERGFEPTHQSSPPTDPDPFWVFRSSPS